MRILKKQHYLCLDSVFDSQDVDFTLRILSNVGSALKIWRSTTRISPIWNLRTKYTNTQSKPAKPSDGQIYFLGSVDPAKLYNNLSTECLSKIGPNDMWLSLGFFSIIIFCFDEDVIDEVGVFCVKFDVRHERWLINRPSSSRECDVDGIHYFDPRDYSSATTSIQPKSAIAFEKIEDAIDDGIAFMTAELYSLASVIETRATDSYSGLAEDTLHIEYVAAQLLPRNGCPPNDDLKISNLKKRDLLLTLNAGLSRLSSQALSGTMPITRTECHFWPHSLLGTGVANLALRNVTEFVTDCVRRSMFHEAYERKFDSDYSLVSGAEFEDEDNAWMADHFKLDRAQIVEYTIDGLDLDAKKSVVPDKTRIPNPITFFSGRDGFRNGYLTTSAPLLSVSGCNCVQWNLGTITHELSHRIVSGKLEDLFKKILDIFDGQDANFDDVKAMTNSEPATIGEFAMKLLALHLVSKYTDDLRDNEFDDMKNLAHQFLLNAKDSYSLEIEENLVHIFDFFHFYGANSRNYVEFIWRSWAVQPSIVEKIDSYLERTIIALAVVHYKHENWKQRAVDDFVSIISLRSFRSRINFIELIEERMSDREFLINLEYKLRRSHFIITLFFLLFRSNKLQNFVMKDPFSTPHKEKKTSSRQSDGQNHAPMSFAEEYNFKAYRRSFYREGVRQPEPIFCNPLLFLRDFSREDTPNAAHSAWLLHMLAHKVRPDERTLEDV